MVALYIEDRLCELKGDETIAIDYAIAKIGEIEKRTGARSAEIQLPQTAVNSSIFESSEIVTSRSQIPYRRLKARLFVDGIDQGIRFATLESVDEDYNIRVYGAQVDFYTSIRDLKLSELDLREFDHFLSGRDVVVNGRVGNDCYTYPIIDYFQDSPNQFIDNANSWIDSRYLRPAPKYEYIIQRIIEAQGYTLNNRAMELPEYPADGLILPFSRDKLIRNNDAGRYNGRFDFTNEFNTGIKVQINFNTFNTPGYDYNYFSTGGTAGSLVFPDALTFDWEIVVLVNNISLSAKNFVLEVILADQSIVQTFSIPPLASNYQVTLSGSEAEGVPGVQGFFAVGAAYSIEPALEAVGGYFEVSNVSIENLEEVHVLDDHWFENNCSAFITLSTVLPDWTQGNLISNYLKLTCSLLHVNEITKVVEILPFQKIIDNIGSCVDWSEKVDFSRKPKVGFLLENYAQKSRLVYAEDETVDKPIGTDGALNVEDENLPEVQDVIVLDFAASQAVERLGGYQVPQLKRLTANGESEGVGQRVLVLRYRGIPSGIAYIEGNILSATTVTTDIPFPYFIEEGQSFNLGFANTLIPLFYTALEAVLDRAKIITIPLRLTATDINVLDFRKPVYISSLNAYFYVSQIKEHQPGANESTMVELVKLF